MSSIFGSVKGIASTALRVAQNAIDAQDEPLPATPSARRPSLLPNTPSFHEKLQSGILVKDAIIALNDAITHSTAMDDRKMLLESIITLLYTLPEDSKVGDTLEKTLIRLLWDDLQHPPVSYLGKAKYRAADGSGNNFQNPQLGAAGQRESFIEFPVLAISADFFAPLIDSLRSIGRTFSPSTSTTP
jgi:linoleate 8R-lipoxygenase/9,12-octadecadienoate 8-hydroperoxide 8R-isomerase